MLERGDRLCQLTYCPGHAGQLQEPQSTIIYVIEEQESLVHVGAANSC